MPQVFIPVPGCPIDDFHSVYHPPPLSPLPARPGAHPPLGMYDTRIVEGQPSMQESHALVHIADEQRGKRRGGSSADAVFSNTLLIVIQPLWLSNT